ncbi:MAG: hypothetical protein OXS35_07450 [Dehalococcoidia bacterium]|nr:hypothetical protein [Dehalococcoidia bacterium]
MDIAMRREALEDMRREILERIDNAKADLRAIDRLLELQPEVEPEPEYSSPDDIRAKAFDILLHSQESVHREELLKRLAESGIRVKERDPV